MDPLRKQHRMVYKALFLLPLNSRKKKKRTKNSIKIRNVKLWVLKITTLNTVQFTNLPQNTTEHSLQDFLFRQITKKTEDSSKDLF